MTLEWSTSFTFTKNFNLDKSEIASIRSCLESIKNYPSLLSILYTIVPILLRTCSYPFQHKDLTKFPQFEAPQFEAIMRLTILLILSGLLRSTLALCPGFNYAFLALQYSYTPKMWPYDVSWKWVVTDAGCGMQLPPCIDDNPCSQCWGLGCSPAPVHVDKIEVNGLWYVWRSKSPY